MEGGNEAARVEEKVRVGVEHQALGVEGWHAGVKGWILTDSTECSRPQ